MFVFDTNGRVQKVTEGIQFYEQDILCSSYDFSGDLKIELNIDYLMPGFGIAMVENEEDGPISKESNAYLFKVGVNEFRVFERVLGQQVQKNASTCIFETGIKNAHLTFTLANRKATLVYHTVNSRQEPIELLLGEFKMDIRYESYKIGFYSNAGNIIRSVTFLGSVPKNWRTSIANTIGGRISFSHSSFAIENCDHVAEVEQAGIQLEPGKYWLKFETEEVDGSFDIVPYVFPTTPKGDGEDELEDDKKNLLKEGGLLHITEPQVLTLKFKGHSGRIRNLTLTNSPYADFVETEDGAFYQDGSSIKLHLDKLVSADWVATVKSIPEWEDLTKPCPYGIIALAAHWYSLEDLGITVGKEYSYHYDVANKMLSIAGKDGEDVFSGPLALGAKDHNTLILMHNVSMVMTSLILTTANGSTTNVIVQKTFKHYIPGNIESPVIVTREGDDESFDLSASYREVVTPATKIKLFSKEAPLYIKEDVPANAHSVNLYGIPKGSRLNTNGKTIQDFSTSYISIPDEVCSFSGRFFTVPQHIRDSYEYLALEYNSIENFSYEFTNYEREIFIPDGIMITLSKPISKNNGDIIIYGIPKGTTVHEEYLYRVPNTGLMNSIDYYADNYDQLDGSLYTVDYTTSQIRMNKNLGSKYSHYVIDYLKRDSYVVNFRNNIRQYEVDVATDAKEVNVHYDMHDDGGIYKFAHTDIRADSAKYIVLRKEEEE